MTPDQPLLGDLVAAEQADTEEIVQAAAVNACNNHLDEFKNLIERPVPFLRSCCCLFPVDCAGPRIVPETNADLDVQVLGVEDLALAYFGFLRLLELAFEPALADGTAQVGVGDVKVRW